MVDLTPATPERFSALAPDPAADLERLQRALSRGTLRPEHLLVVSGGGVDVARAALATLEDGTTLAHAFRLDAGRLDAEGIYRVLLDGLAGAARSSGLTRVHTTVVDADEPEPHAKRAALAAAGWELDGDRLELHAQTVRHPRPDDVVEIDPADPAVVAVMAAAMAESLDDYDRDQVAALGADAAAAGYRDMMVGGGAATPWLAHRGSEGVDGIVAIGVYPRDWSLSYLGVAPTARRRGVGGALARAMLSAAAEAGMPTATASAAVANPPIRATLERVGFTVRSPRTDFVLHLGAD
jgi:ribosomal protein S18 acetylase RimI-like enzyme